MLNLRVEGFEWDAGNCEKCQKHGVSRAEIEEVFRNDPRVAPDVSHSAAEDRLIAVGRTKQGRPVFVAFTLRMRQGRRVIRPVSARYMHAKEVVSYEKKEGAKAED